MAAVSQARAIDPPATMSIYQYAVVALCCLINVADGFDVVSLAVAAPVLTKQWHVDPAILGAMFSSAAFGLVIGAFLIGPMADKWGRRPIMLGALGSLALTLLLSGVATDIWQLFVLRTITGIGLGTLVVCLNTTVADHASEKARNLSLAILHIGFTFGMMLGSGVAAYALQTGGWRMIFLTAGALNAVTFTCALFLLGESRDFLVRRQAAGDLDKLNRTHRRMGIAPLAQMPPRPAAATDRGAAIRAMLSPELRSWTILVWIASATYAIVGYFLLNWKPTILANAGLSPALAAASGIITGACGTVGHLTMGMLGRKIGEGRLTAIYFACAAVTLVIFGVMPPAPIPLLAVAGITTFFVVGAYTGLFLVSVTMYPPAIQNAGVGYVVGFGRIGAIIGPSIGGFLLSAGLSRMDTYFVFSAIAVIPVVTMYLANRVAARGSRHRDVTGSGAFDAEPAL
ncbi:MFS transporter [Sphingomonas psychrotolerans]|uniref:MFS transporter n=1 Tax=Sphingomonas psychrotolerans TaxID=1327635 RepID=A0ABU3N8S1_9SPHN|nr:MFS transporter [Sphingomonas psychrotolerans]MDT8760187.1 MFS transporter [Sphingomonas psychrotolerans]